MSKLFCDFITFLGKKLCIPHISPFNAYNSSSIKKYDRNLRRLAKRRLCKEEKKKKGESLTGENVALTVCTL